MFRHASQSRSGEDARLRCCEAHRWSTAIRLHEREELRAGSPSLIAAIAGPPSRSVLYLSHRIWERPDFGCRGRCLARTTLGCPRDQRRPGALGPALQGSPDNIRPPPCLRETHRRHSERPRRDCCAALPTTPERFQLSNCIPDGVGGQPLRRSHELNKILISSWNGRGGRKGNSIGRENGTSSWPHW
jgi:hypothetical protein